MRSPSRAEVRREGEESAFVTMTDMTVGFLFIIMLLMAFFAARYAEDTRLEAYLQQATEARKKLLEDLRAGIQAHLPHLEVTVSDQGDALRFQGSNLFDSNKYELLPQARQIVDAVADTLHEILPCYTRNHQPRPELHCDASGAMIEAVQIEGHTDSEGLEMNNMQLSAARANVTFGAMIGRESALKQHLNYGCEPVLSVAGYGWMRPVASNDTEKNRARNRRIDLRIIMHSPTGAGDIEAVMTRLREPCEEAL